MASYYNKIEGTLESGNSARADDIHLIQASIQKAIKEVIVDICGPGFILGEYEDALKLTITDKHTDQVNLNYDDASSWVSFYDIYLRQPIDIEKSSIETIRLHMYNDTNISPTIYAEIRDEDLELLQEANAVLPGVAEGSNEYEHDIDFNFNLNHLDIGRYYFILRPVDISATDLSKTENLANGLYNTITPENFLVRYDADGSYNQGLEASFDGETFLEANILEENIVTDEENIPDLYFEEIFSSGTTYLVDTESAAVVLGEKVYPSDTHVTIEESSDDGDRTDLVTLTTDGQLIVTKGTVYTDDMEKIYPTNSGGLDIAYITTHKTSSNKLPYIEQSDDSGSTRIRDILERLRRVEKQVNYQSEYNAPTRVVYNCEVDPILDANTIDNNSSCMGEGTYGLSSSLNANGKNVIGGTKKINYAWSIIKDNYTYNVDTKTNENCKIQVWDVYTTEEKDKNYNLQTNGIYFYHAVVKDHSTSTPKPVKNLDLTIQIKKGGATKKTLKKKTDSNGHINFTIFPLKLSKGTYTVYTIYKSTKIKSKLVVYKKSTKLDGKKENVHEDTVSIDMVSGTSVTNKLPTGVFAGNDSFYTENVDVDTTRGEVRVKKISNITDAYEINDGRALLRNTKKYKSSDYNYVINNKKNKNGVSKIPALHVTFDRDVYIKSITPYIESFENIKSIGILMFKNDIIRQRKKKKTYTKKVGAGKVSKTIPDDKNFPTVYKSKFKSLKNLVKKTKSKKKVVPKEPIKFDDVNLDLEAGTYTIVLCPKLSDTKKDGSITIKMHKTKHDINIYGTTETVQATQKLSSLKIDTKNASDSSWDIGIEHKTYRYYDKGILQSKPINTGISFSACKPIHHITVPSKSGCKYKLSVSNDGGRTWVNASTSNKAVNFKTSGTSFRWKIEFVTDNMFTPKLKFNQTRKYAIGFRLGKTSVTTVEYEDYGRCYETPLFNANTITRNYTRSPTVNTFNEWEFARIFMEDEDMSSKIDILISYSTTDYKTSASTDKGAWDKSIFFSTVFADLTLKDFSQSSINYDNYEGNTEYDENNYRFSLNTQEIHNYTGGLTLAYPTSDEPTNTDVEYVYGDITTSKDMKKLFSYDYIDEDSPGGEYKYVGNEGDDEHKYAGMHIVGGPYKKAVFLSNTLTNSISQEVDFSTIKSIHFYARNLTGNNKVTVYIGETEKTYNCTNEWTKYDFDTTEITGKKILKFVVDNIYPVDISYITVTDNSNKEEVNNTIIKNSTFASDLSDWTISSSNTQYISQNKDGHPQGGYVSISSIGEELQSDDTIIGVRFNHGLKIDENITDLNIGLVPHIASSSNNTKEVFPSGTFKITVSLGSEGEADNATTGREYVIEKELTSDVYTEYSIDLSPDDFESFQQNGINSIGIKLCDASTAVLKKDDSIGIGRITSSPHNRRTYIPYMYTGSQYRLRWQKITNNEHAQAFSIYTVGDLATGTDLGYSEYKIFYPIINSDKDTAVRRIMSNTDKCEKTHLNPDTRMQFWQTRGTHYRRRETYTLEGYGNKGTNGKYLPTMRIKRNNSQFITGIYDENGFHKYVTNDTGNQILFELPSGETGNLFKINVKIPYLIYNLVDIEYFIFAQWWRYDETDKPKNIGGDTGCNIRQDSEGNVYQTEGSFSKGEIFIDLYSSKDIDKNHLIESFALPAWGRTATRSEVYNKRVYSWFNRRGNSHETIRCIVIRRENPRNLAKSKILPIKFVLNDILFFNAEHEAALGPQMQMRIYPKEGIDGSNTTIRKVGGVYRI